jgi:lysyl-tRNA synthetase class 2
MELYWRGLELANGFHELSDPRENEARFAADRAVKARLGREPFPQDEALLAALRSGMPPSGGIALGLDRLFMALMECEQIGETRPFPFRAQ